MKIINIRLNIEELRTSSANLKSYSQEIGNTIQGIDKVINALPENWEGQTALSFQAIFYPDSLESINNNNSISYNTLITIEKELSAACAMIEDNSSASLKQLKQG